MIEEVRLSLKYLVVIEQGPSSFGAYVPDLPGCVAVGESRAEVTRLIHEAIEFHLEGMQEDGIPIPEPHSTSEVVEVRA
jgi:predicted RNase H-like HicB family nuclease